MASKRKVVSKCEKPKVIQDLEGETEIRGSDDPKSNQLTMRNLKFYSNEIPSDPNGKNCI